MERGAASNVYMYLSNVPANSTVDLTGIQYLKMATLSISGGAGNNISVTWPGYPRANSHLILTDMNAQLFSPSLLPLHSEMNIFECDACGLATVPDFEGVMMHFKNVDLSGQTVTIPNSVGWLALDNDNLSTLPSMPNVAMLSISDNPLANWTNLPTGLASLTANNVGLTYLPTLPTALGTFDYNNNGLLTLPALPASLGTLFLQNNALTSIPAFPPNLSFLVVSHNPITSFPSMPSGLANVTADSCALVTLGPLASRPEFVEPDREPHHATAAFAEQPGHAITEELRSFGVPAVAAAITGDVAAVQFGRQLPAQHSAQPEHHRAAGQSGHRAPVLRPDEHLVRDPHAVRNRNRVQRCGR